MMPFAPTRRHFLTTAALASAGISAGISAGTSALRGAEAKPLAKPPVESFDFAYLTDIHVQPELRAVQGFQQCLASVNALPQRPDFMITGGDLIMDALDVGADRIHTQFTLFDECMKHCALPVHHTLGNHDVVGWSHKAIVKPDHHEYGKRLFAERYGQGRTYRSWDHKGWHFILLDSIGQNTETLDYQGWIDDAQLDWLKADLSAVGKTRPIIIVSHIPFYSVWHQVIFGPGYKLDGKALVNNLHTFRKLLDQYNIPLVLSGHGHIVERIEVGRSTYIQGGAVSGMWWKGPVHGHAENYGIITCRSDGTWAWQDHDYGWKA
jgi:3',5'-cyclic AMP phosphodiesterase CpdA